MSKKLHIVAVTALIKSGDGKRLLVVKRGEHEVAHPGKWSFPGGKLEEGERIMDALRREVQEEVGIAIADEKRFLRDFGFMRGGQQWVVGMCFEVYATSEEVTLADDFDDFRWVTPEELQDMDCIPTLLEGSGPGIHVAGHRRPLLYCPEYAFSAQRPNACSVSCPSRLADALAKLSA